jgi:hypothetical protein
MSKKVFFFLPNFVAKNVESTPVQLFFRKVYFDEKCDNVRFILRFFKQNPFYGQRACTIRLFTAVIYSLSQYKYYEFIE